MASLKYEHVSLEEENSCINKYKLSNNLNDLSPLFKKLNYMIERVLNKSYVPENEREDIIQEIYAEVAKHTPKFINNNIKGIRFCTYFGSTFLTREVWEYCKKLNTKGREMVTLWGDEQSEVSIDCIIDPVNDNPETNCSRDEISSALMESINSLSDKQRTAVKKVMLGPLTKTQNLTRSHYQNGVVKLRDIFNFGPNLLEEYL